MAHQVEFAVSAVRELADLKAYQRKRIHGEIKKQLIDQPTMATRTESAWVTLLLILSSLLLYGSCESAIIACVMT